MTRTNAGRPPVERPVVYPPVVANAWSDPGEQRPSLVDRAAVCAIVYAFFFGAYALVNRSLPLASAADWSTPLDRGWPLVPWMIWPFYLTYSLILVPAIVTRSRQTLVRLAIAFTLLVAASCLLFVLLPVSVARPAVVPNSLSGRLLASIYRNDRPVCGFPSLHVSGAVLAAAVLFRERRGWGLLFAPFAFATSISTLFVKQHVVADVLGGAALGLAVEWTVMGAGPAVARAARAAWTLARLPASRPASVRESRCTTVSGTEYDLYEPRVAKRALLVVHGLTTTGERDERIIAFARAFARAGFRVAVPVLAGLKALREDHRDPQALLDAAAAIRTRSGAPVPVAAFSFGTSIALVAASRPAARELLGSLVLIGACHALEDLWRRQTDVPPDREDAWDDFIFAQLLLAVRQGPEVLDDAEHAEATALLATYCESDDAGAKRAFWRRALAGKRLAERSVAGLDAHALTALSPAGKLDQVVSRVFIIHDPGDRLIPVEQARRAYAELKTRALRDGERLLVSPIVAHVNLRDLWRVPDIARLLVMLGMLWDDAPCPPTAVAESRPSEREGAALLHRSG